MATFIMLGKYTNEGLKGISKERTQGALNLIRELNGEVRSIYALLGTHDLHLTVDFPGIKEAMRASIELNKLTGITFTTSEAVTAAEFDEFMT